MQETWLGDEADLSLFEIENYTLISPVKSCSARGGLAIYVKESYETKILDICQKSDIWESLFIEITHSSLGKKVILGNIYRPPRDLVENYRLFNEELTVVLNKLQRLNSEVIIGGDFNIDLLKIPDKPSYATFF